MLEVFSGWSIGFMLQTIAPALFLFGALACVVIVLGILSLIFRADARAEAMAAVQNSVRYVKHFLL